MGFYVGINYKITGQVEDFETQRLIKAKLELMCAEYDLEMGELEEDDEF